MLSTQGFCVLRGLSTQGGSALKMGAAAAGSLGVLCGRDQVEHRPRMELSHSAACTAVCLFSFPQPLLPSACCVPACLPPLTTSCVAPAACLPAASLVLPLRSDPVWHLQHLVPVGRGLLCSEPVHTRGGEGHGVCTHRQRTGRERQQLEHLQQRVWAGSRLDDCHRYWPG